MGGSKSESVLTRSFFRQAICSARLRAVAGAVLCLAAALWAAPAGEARAATLYWDTTDTIAGAGVTPTGTWGTDNFWNTDPTGGAGGTLHTATIATDDLYFVAGPASNSGNNAFTVTVSGAQVANSLNFQCSGKPTISDAGGSITLGDGTAGHGGIIVPQKAYVTTNQGAPTISTPIILNNSQTWTVGDSRTLTVSGAVTESGSSYTLTKSGPGILVLSGANSYSGGTVIDEDLLQFNTGAVPATGQIAINPGGTLAATGAYASAGDWLASNNIAASSSGVLALTTDNTAAADFTGYDNLYLGATGNRNFGAYTLTAGANGYLLGGGGKMLTLNGANTLGEGANLTVGDKVTISAANSSFNGTVTVNAGTLALSAASALGNPSLVTVAGGGTLSLSTAVGASALDNIPLTIAGGTLDVILPCTVDAPITLDNGGLISTQLTAGATMILNRGITGTGDLTLRTSIADTSVIVLGAASDYSGNTTIDNVGVGGNLAVQLGAMNALPAGTALTINSTWGTKGRFIELDLNGHNQTVSGLSTTGSGASIYKVTIVNSSGTPATLTVNNTADYTFGGLLGSDSYPTDVNLAPDPLSLTGNSFGLTKSGPGKLTLTNNHDLPNSYTGDTIISGGTLALSGAYTNNIATSPTIKVAGGAGLNVTGLTGGRIVLGSAQTLTGGGVVTGSVATQNGTKIAPGDNAVGTLTVTGDVTMGEGAVYEWQFGSSAADGVDIGGSLMLDSGWVLNLVDAGGTPGADPYPLFTYGTFSGDFEQPTITGDWASSDVTITQDDTHVYLTFSSLAVPGDTNEDRVVDAADFITLKKNFNQPGAGAAQGNFNSDVDGVVDWADLSILMSNMGVPGGAPSVPEPATLGLLVFGALAVIRRRRRA